MIDVKQNKDD